MVVQVAFPDIEPIIVGLLGAAVDGVHPCVELPPAEEFNRILAELLGIVQVTRIGGISTGDTWSHGYMFDQPTLDLDMYAAGRQAANEAVQLVRAAVGSLKGAVSAGAGIIYCRENAGPTYRPDASQNITRIGFTADLLVRPVPIT